MLTKGVSFFLVVSKHVHAELPVNNKKEFFKFVDHAYESTVMDLWLFFGVEI